MVNLRSALLTDLYQLTMACGYWKSASASKEAVFHLFFRKSPFGGGFTVAAGLADAIDFLRDFRFQESELSYLDTLNGADGQPLFERAFLNYLRGLRFSCDVEGVPEGTVVFPQEPLLRVKGSLLEAQLVETALLNFINFQSLVATKAARLCLAARGEPIIEFGLRRAQGPDGGVTASRAAFLGGCAATSNLLAGMKYGIPVRGTHAHSWVMSFKNEPEAFRAYAGAMPNNCIFLVDTYDSIEGVRHAVEVGRQLREAGHKLVGIRLDSGDLAYLSIQARKILDEAGFPEAAIVASNDLDERLIESLKQQGAAINVWGVGTKLVTAYDQPALGGVYKLSAIRSAGGDWEHKIKLSEQAAKVTTPGIQQVRRFRSATEFIGDAIYDETNPPARDWIMVDPMDPTRHKSFEGGTAHEDLLVPIFRQGRLVYDIPPLTQSRQRVQEQLALFHAGIKRFVNPHQYPVGLEAGLHRAKLDLVLKARGPRAEMKWMQAS